MSPLVTRIKVTLLFWYDWNNNNYTKSTLDTVIFKSTPETVKYLTSTLTPPFKDPKRIGEYAWADGKEFGVRIGWRMYLYECTPFGYVNLWYKNSAWTAPAQLGQVHMLTSKRDVHLFRYFLSLMHTPHVVTKHLKKKKKRTYPSKDKNIRSVQLSQAA